MREPEVLDTEAPDPNPGHPPRNGATVIFPGGHLHVPAWVTDIDTFRRWTDTTDYPEDGNIWWLRGEVWADMSKEQIFTHLFVKQEFFRVLGNLAKSECPGVVIPDGLLLSNVTADISGNPDATYISTATLDTDRVNLIQGATGGFVEIEGAPDMVLEVVSDSSVGKDTETLLVAYWKAGIPEYWLADAREDELTFDIFRRGPKGYKRTPKKHGWIASAVFAKSFRLSVKTDPAGRPDYTLDVR
jgi:Uma2 family endonuclease